MIAKSVIMITLVGIVLTGLVPVGSLILMAVNKIKSSSFWAGVLAYVIGFLSYTLFSTIVSMFIMANKGALQPGADVAAITLEATEDIAFVGMLQAVVGIMLALAMTICISAPMKKTRTVKGAVSCGLGFGASYSVMSLISFIGYYNNFASINSGKFDAKYINYIDIGIFTKETLAAMKEQYISITASELLMSVAATVLGAIVMISCAMIIMRFVCAKKTVIGGLTAIVGFAATFMIPSVMSNIYAAIAITAVISLALLFLALKLKEGIVPPAAPSYASDSFMQSLEKAKADDAEIGNVSDFMKSDAKAKAEGAAENKDDENA